MKKEGNKKFRWLKILIFCFLLLLSIILYTRYIEPTHIIVDEENAINTNLPNSFYGYKIVQLSDIHYNTTITKKELKYTVEKINRIKPNIVVITGDLLDKSISYNENDKLTLIDLLNNINGKYKYIITGDHDNNELFKEIIEKTDFKLLDNTYDIIYNGDYDPILIGGISTRTDGVNIDEKIMSIENAIIENKTTYNILIMHEPSIVENINYNNYQLILAGHTHNGQVNIPGIKKLLIPEKDNKYTKTYYSLEDTDLYISPGIGTSNIKARLLNSPTINLYRLLDK